MLVTANLTGERMDLSALRAGLLGEASLVVGEAHTARAMGSGSEPVFATPALVALMEAAAVACAERLLPEGHISLGTEIHVEHLAASVVGARISSRAELVAVEGRVIRFALTAKEGDKLIGKGTHSRAIVERARFLARLGSGQ